MQPTLDFRQIEAITSRLSNAQLVGLVAIFSRQENNDLLLVFLSEALTDGIPAECAAINLDALLEWDLTLYDGIVIAFPALEVMRVDVPTKGGNFYSLDRILRSRGLIEQLHQTLAGLSKFLLQLLQDPAWRPANELSRLHLTAEIAGMVVPPALAKLPRKNLVALFLTDGIEAFVEQGACAAVYCQFLPDEPIPPEVHPYLLQSLDLPPELQNEEKVIAFEALWSVWNLIHEQTGGPFPLSLRTALQKGGLDGTLSDTLSTLASLFYQDWQNNTDQVVSLHTVYDLVAELWLDKVEIDDLAAILPADDFEQFIKTGAGCYIYRHLPEHPKSEGPFRYYSVAEIAPAPTLPVGYGRFCFSLLPIKNLLLNRGAEMWSDLGPLLHRTRRTSSLIRSGWLLVRDLTELPQSRWSVWDLSPADMAQSIIHTWALISLANPWKWRQGRHEQILHQLHKTLLQLFEVQTKNFDEPARFYYQALGLWHSCVHTKADEVEFVLQRVVKLLNQFENSRQRLSHPLTAQARQLKNVSQAVLHMFGGGGQPEVIQSVYAEALQPGPSSVARMMNMAAEEESLIDVPSPLFRQVFQRYAAAITTIHQLRSSEIPLEDKIISLKQKIAGLQQDRRVAFALIHEKNMLDILYKRAIEDNQQRVEELQGSAQLEIFLSTSSAVQHRDSLLAFEVKNIGRVEARVVEVTLFESERFQLIEESRSKRLPDIPSNVTERFEFSLRPLVNDNFPVRLKLTYRDKQQTSRQELRVYRREFVVQIQSLDRGPFIPKPNPYIYGLPLQEPQFFYGRRRDLESALNHLTGGGPQNILIRGARRMGKTSLLYMVKAIIEDRNGAANGARAWFNIPENWCEALDRQSVVLLDLQGLERETGNLTPASLYKAILSSLAELGLSQVGDAALSKINLTPTRFERLLAQIFKENEIASLVLLVDEFDIIDLSVDRNFYSHLRHTITHIQKITWIIASGLGLYKEIHDYESPLFNVFKIIDLKKLKPKTAEKLILSPWEGNSVRVGESSPAYQPSGKKYGAKKLPTLDFAADAVDAILYETGCHPYFIQLLCSHIVEQVNADRTNYVLRSTVYDVISELIAPYSAANEHFAYLWDQAGSVGRTILLCLLQSVEPLTLPACRHILKNHLELAGIQPDPAIFSKTFNDNLRRLEIVEAVNRDSNNRLVFGIPLFRRILAGRNERDDLWENALQELRNG